MTKTFLILTAMPEEMAYLNHQFPEPKSIKEGHLEFFESHFQGVRVITAVSGIGKVNAAIATTLGIQRFRPDMVINIGASGGLSKELHLGDIVMASMLQYHDADATRFGYVMGQIPRMPVCYEVDKKIIQHLASKKNKFTFKIFSGLICAGDSFVADENFSIQIKKNFPAILALDMESCAVAQTCHQLEVEFCCIRGISDGANEAAEKKFLECLALAMKNANQVLLELLA